VLSAAPELIPKQAILKKQKNSAKYLPFKSVTFSGTKKLSSAKKITAEIQPVRC
jgi:hypothetical protein